ncbi:hypothetical protein [Hydrogenivirga sp.]
MARKIGLDGAVLLSTLLLQKNGVFEGHSRELEEITGIKYNKLLKVRHHLRRLELIEEKRVGIPPKLRIVLTEKGKELINNGEGHARKT